MLLVHGELRHHDSAAQSRQVLHQAGIAHRLVPVSGAPGGAFCSAWSDRSDGAPALVRRAGLVRWILVGQLQGRQPLAQVVLHVVDPQAQEHMTDHARPPPVVDRMDLPRPGLPRPEGHLHLGEPLVRGDPLGPVRRLRQTRGPAVPRGFRLEGGLLTGRSVPPGSPQ